MTEDWNYMHDNLQWDSTLVNYARACLYSNSTGIHDESLYDSGSTGLADSDVFNFRMAYNIYRGFGSSSRSYDTYTRQYLTEPISMAEFTANLNKYMTFD